MMSMVIANPAMAWDEMTPETQAQFLLVAVRTVSHDPLPDPGWPGLVEQGLAVGVDGNLILAPVGIHLMLYIAENVLEPALM